MTDSLQKFMFEQTPIRGEFIHLTESWQHIQDQHHYPPAVSTILGEMLCAAALLCATLKFDGTIIMQIYGDGPIRLLVVECNNRLQIRATAKFSADTVIDSNATLSSLINAQGKGHFVVTLDPDNKKPGQQAYQGIVPLEGETVSAIIENYMLRSEQLETRLWLAADQKTARGLLLQKLPKMLETSEAEEESEETWERLSILSCTLKTRELLQTEGSTLLRRLFWEETVRLFDAQTLHFHCTCSREKVANMLKMLGRAEVESIVAEKGKVKTDCDFCGQRYEFEATDCAELFTEKSAQKIEDRR